MYPSRRPSVTQTWRTTYCFLRLTREPRSSISVIARTRHLVTTLAHRGAYEGCVVHLSVPRNVTRRGASCVDEEEALDSGAVVSQSLRMYGGIVPDVGTGIRNEVYMRRDSRVRIAPFGRNFDVFSKSRSIYHIPMSERIGLDRSVETGALVICAGHFSPETSLITGKRGPFSLSPSRQTRNIKVN